MNTHDNRLDGEALLTQLAGDFIGLDQRYPTLDGEQPRRVYLDSAASTLMMAPAWRFTRDFLSHYANSHSELHHAARISTATFEWARQQVLAFCQADPAEYACVFLGSGATAGINRMASMLADYRRASDSPRDLVLVSGMEHHSNDLPHRRHATRLRHLSVIDEGPRMGLLDHAALKSVMAGEGERVSYLAVTAASNVTGLINPLDEIAAMMSEVGALLLVDASQYAAHAPLDLSGDRPKPDAVMFSGHKIYVPGSPGVMIVRRELLAKLSPGEVGGGMVEAVYLDGYRESESLEARHEAGTPNIPGAVTLGAALALLARVGMSCVAEHEQTLIEYALDELAAVPGVRLYGSTDLRAAPRTGTIAFNLDGLDHGLLAAVLNDWHGIAVRNECFCAHPYVRDLMREELVAWDVDPDAADFEAQLKRRQGMVRASFGLYSSRADVDRLVAALRDFSGRTADLQQAYHADEKGNYQHRSQPAGESPLFDPGEALISALKG